MKEKIKSVIDDYTALVYKIQNAISRWSTIRFVAYGDKNVYVEYYFLRQHVKQLHIPFEWFDLDDEEFANKVKGILTQQITNVEHQCPLKTVEGLIERIENLDHVWVFNDGLTATDKRDIVINAIKEYCEVSE